MYPFLLSTLFRHLVTRFGKSPLEGAATALYAATSAEVRASEERFAGAYVVPYGRIGKATKDGQDGALAKTLWDLTQSIVDTTLMGSYGDDSYVSSVLVSNTRIKRFLPPCLYLGSEERAFALHIVLDAKENRLLRLNAYPDVNCDRLHAARCGIV